MKKFEKGFLRSNNYITVSLVLAAIGFSALLTAACYATGIIFTGDFETGDLSGFHRETCLDCPQAIQITTNPVRSGKYAARFELGNNDLETKANGAGSYRSEIALPAEPTGNMERWYAFSMYLPDDYKSDPVNEVVAQWHNTDDVAKGELRKTSPPTALRTINGNWMVSWQWDSRKVIPLTGDVEGKAEKVIGPYKLDKWTDWVFHFKRSFKNDGLIEVWQNGEKVLEHKGPNTYNDEVGVYFKTGIYKAQWKGEKRAQSTTDKRILYVDEIRVGDEKATLQTMMPSPSN